MDSQRVVAATGRRAAADALLREELSGLYFAYGSNMNEGQIRARCSKPVAVAVARLAGHRVSFHGYSRTWDGGLETVVPAPGHHVWGVLYKLSFRDWDHLDAWQGARLDGSGAYFHFPVRVTAADGSAPAVLLYKKDILGPPRKPSREYLAHIVSGAVQHRLPSAYIDELRATASAPATFGVPLRSRFDPGVLVETPCSECAELHVLPQASSS